MVTNFFADAEDFLTAMRRRIENKISKTKLNGFLRHLDEIQIHDIELSKPLERTLVFRELIRSRFNDGDRAKEISSILNKIVSKMTSYRATNSGAMLAFSPIYTDIQDIPELERMAESAIADSHFKKNHFDELANDILVYLAMLDMYVDCLFTDNYIKKDSRRNLTESILSPLH